VRIGRGGIYEPALTGRAGYGTGFGAARFMGVATWAGRATSFALRDWGSEGGDRVKAGSGSGGLGGRFSAGGGDEGVGGGKPSDRGGNPSDCGRDASDRGGNRNVRGGTFAAVAGSETTVAAIETRVWRAKATVYFTGTTPDFTETTPDFGETMVARSGTAPEFGETTVAVNVAAGFGVARQGVTTNGAGMGAGWARMD
jgi:hypothetical protein